MADAPLAGRTGKQVLRDALAGIALGLGVALVFSAWVLFVNSWTQGGVEERYDVEIWGLVAVYFGGLGVAGAAGGLLRPWLGTLVGQAVLCWVAAFALYGGVQLVMPPLFGNVLMGGVVMATFATPVWLGVLHFRGGDKDLRAAAGLPPRPRPPPTPVEETWVVYRSLPSGGHIRVKSLQGRDAAEREAERLRALGFGHRYWTERA